MLLDPPVKPETWLLWFGPALLLLVAGYGVVRYLRRRQMADAPAPLDAAERKRLEALLRASDGDDARSAPDGRRTP